MTKNTLLSFTLSQEYKKVSRLGDRLKLINEKIDWKNFKPILSKIFYDDKKTGGRPHTKEEVIIKCLVLQAWYGLSDEQLEYQLNDRISFRNFIGVNNNIPDFTTIWKIRERIIKAEIEKDIWNELKRQLKQKNIEVKKGVIQDASIIEADLGKKRNYKEKKAKKKGKEIKYTDKQINHMDKDASFTIKRGQVYYGYKLHTKMDVANHMIWDYKVTSAKVHDNQIDLVKKNDKKAYRDRAYSGKKIKAKNVKDMTMVKKRKGKKLTKKDKKRNIRISKIRAIGERPYSVIKRVFNNGKVFVKNIKRVTIKQMFNCFSYNLYNLATILKKNKA